MTPHRGHEKQSFGEVRSKQSLGTSLGKRIDVRVGWVVKRVFEPHDDDGVDPMWDFEETQPSQPAHLLPGQQTELSGHPLPRMMDPDSTITRAEGIVTIRYKDIMAQQYETRCEFDIFVDHAKSPPLWLSSFSNLQTKPTKLAGTLPIPQPSEKQ